MFREVPRKKLAYLAFGMKGSVVDRIQGAVNDARKTFDASGSGAAVTALVRGLRAVRELRRSLSSMGISADAAFEIEHRLRLKETQFGEAPCPATRSPG